MILSRSDYGVLLYGRALRLIFGSIKSCLASFHFQEHSSYVWVVDREIDKGRVANDDSDEYMNKLTNEVKLATINQYPGGFDSLSIIVS